MVIDQLRLGLRTRLGVELQTEAAECALACLSMIANYHGYRTDLASLRRRFPVSLKGARLNGIVDVANRLGLATRPLRLELEDLDKLRCPCILHWNFNHFVVLKAVRGNSIEIHDPAAGFRRLTHDEVSPAFTGVALELWPNQDFEPRSDRSDVRLRDLMGRVTGLFRSLGQILLLALALEIFAIASPLFLQWVIDHVLVSFNNNLLTMLALGFLLLTVLQQSIAGLRSWVIMYFSTNLSIQWQANVFTHLLRLPLSYFEKRHLGDTVSRFRSIDVIQRTLTTTFIEAIADGAVTLITLIVIFLYSPLLSWICVGALTIYALIRWAWFAPLRHATEQNIVHAARQESHFLETVRGVKAIKLYRCRAERRTSWLALLVNQINAGLRTQKLQIFYRLAEGLLFGIENVVVIWLGATLVLGGQMTAGMLIAFLAYKRQFATRVAALVDKYCELRMLGLQGERLADIVMTEPEDIDETERLALSDEADAEPTIELRGLRFRYAEHEPWVLDGIDLRIEAGESVAIVGPSGCGKTTLMHLMLGILAPTEGDILIGDRDMRQAGADTVRALIGSVTQDDTLFDGTIADNISFFSERRDQSRVEECAYMAAIHDEIISMPMAYNTFVGYMGSALSGGQTQRVLLARALYRRPKILLLDEATAHLDLDRERQVNSAVRSLNVTRVIIAHRPQTVAQADRVVTIEGGRLAGITQVTGQRPQWPSGGRFGEMPMPAVPAPIT